MMQSIWTVDTWRIVLHLQHINCLRCYFTKLLMIIAKKTSCELHSVLFAVCSCQQDGCHNYANLIQRRCIQHFLCNRVIIQMMHGSEWTLKYDEPEVEIVVRGRSSSATFSTKNYHISMSHERPCFICFVVWPFIIIMTYGRPWCIDHIIMINVTWLHFDQSAKQLIVGHTTVPIEINTWNL